MEIRGNLTWTDMQRYHYFVMLRNNWMKAPLWVAAFLTLTALGIVFELHPITLFLSLYFAGQHVYAYVWCPVVLAKASLTNVATGDPVTYSLNEQTFDMIGGNLSLSVAWAGCGEVYETKHLFIVCIPHKLSHQIPKRFFESSEQLEAFRTLLRARIPSDNFKPAGLPGRLW